jgi:hypothetical protein
MFFKTHGCFSEMTEKCPHVLKNIVNHLVCMWEHCLSILLILIFLCDYYNANPRHREKFEDQLLWLTCSLYIDLEQNFFQSRFFSIDEFYLFIKYCYYHN